MICLHRIAYYSRHTLKSRPGPSEKGHPGPLEEVDSNPEFNLWVKNAFLTNLRVMISNIIEVV